MPCLPSQIENYTDRDADVSLGRGQETLKVIVERDLVQSEQLLLALCHCVPTRSRYPAAHPHSK